MNTEISQKTLTNGLFLGFAISSRFLLNFQDGIWSEIVSFILLFGIYSALIMWLKEYQKTLPENKISLKKIIAFTFKTFLIGGIISSLFKFAYFQHLKPDIFATITSQYDQIYSEYILKINQLLEDARKQNKPNDVLILQEGLTQLKWWKSIVISSYFEPIMSLFINLLGGLFLGWFIWPIFKINQQKPTSIKQ